MNQTWGKYDVCLTLPKTILLFVPCLQEVTKTLIWNNYFWGNGEYQTHDHITYLGRSKETACRVTNAILGFYIHRTIYSGWKTALKSQSISERAPYTFTTCWRWSLENNYTSAVTNALFL